MAEDGMLLNIAEPAGDWELPKPKFRGGKWRDRLAAKRAWEASSRPGNSIPKFGAIRSEDEELIHPDAPAAKRPRHTGHIRPAGQAVQPANREVISSLFTYNPVSKITKQEETSPEEPVQPSNAPLSDELASFTSLGLSTTLANHLLKKMDITAPTAIQKQSIEQLCRADRDAFIQAETGSGKTLAYLLPIVQRLVTLSKQMKDTDGNFDRHIGLFAIILAPTRELSKQISVVLENLLHSCNWIVGGVVTGGEKKKSEKARLRKGVNILVATPGRLVDHLDNTEVLDVHNVRWLVLDEGDRLMELGFEKDIQKIVSVLNIRSRTLKGPPITGLPTKRTTILCSATLKTDVEQLQKIALKDPVFIAANKDSSDTVQADGGQTETFSAPAQLKQSFTIVPAKQRLVTLIAFLKQTFRRKGSVMKCVVFFSCADSVDFHFDVLTRGSLDMQEDATDITAVVPKLPKTTPKGQIAQANTIAESRTQSHGTAFASKDNPVQVFRLHGSLQQATRTSTLKAFTKCASPSLLVCTDVASRGLDLPDIDLVIEYDPPFSKDDHLHRIGRTARAGRDGRANIFLMPGPEEGYVDILKGGRQRNLTRYESDYLLKKGFSPTSGVVTTNEWEDAATDCQLDIERWVQENPNHLEQARRAFQSHVRAYATHVAAERGMFDMKQLHLGHLAKAFALRDKPGDIRVPGLRPDGNSDRKKRRDVQAQAGKSTTANGTERSVDLDQRDSRKKMMAKLASLGGVSEFNLG